MHVQMTPGMKAQLLGLLVVGLLVLSSHLHAIEGVKQALSQAEVLVGPYSEEIRPPDDSRAWQPFNFDTGVDNREQELITLWVRTEFSLNTPLNEPLQLYLPRLYHGGRIYLNGTLLAWIRGDDPTTQARWLRPHLISLPLDTLQQGDNQLLIKMDTRWPNATLGVPLVGSEDLIQPRYFQRYFVEHGLIVISVTVLLLGGLFLLAIWVRRRKEVGYALFGLAMLAWGLRSAYNLLPLIPLDYWLLSRAVFYGLTGFGNILLCLFILRTAQFHRRWLERSALAYATAGPLTMLLIGERFVQWDAWWYLGAMPLNVFAVLLIFRATWQQPSWDRIALATGIVLSVAAFVHDSALQAGWLTYSDIYLSYIAVSLILASMGLVLVARFTDALQWEETNRYELAQRVKERERELAANYESLRELEAEQVRTSERQRIMRDMHDGLGSQLLSSLVLVEASDLNHQQVAQVLRECLDDMRLVIDTLSLEDGDLVTALGTLRFRMEPRLKRAGITISWKLQGAVEEIELGPEEALAILRIVQEALSNVLKHAQATRIEFTLQQAAQGLQLSIRDNGCGFDLDSKANGRGLTNLHKRATSIGGELQIFSDSSGTEVQLTTFNA
ncbi:Signal transduction histidine kinase [Marinospirillum celere]|uniref:Signal transduction histidine kinase n=1 Tax=Marinospirillum celere TaxID=1122252 RepID=A0A1I1JMY4_9GAMM|nr:sensor histidine kinase [Marinospirillum celere]SFC49904.1 Signal transduction histidine kinase [Marinospirillum celere]